MVEEVFSYFVEVAALNAYVLDKHTRVGRSMRDYLRFRLALAEELVGSFRGRSQVGSRWSLDQMDMMRLDQSLGYWPEVADRTLEYAMCLKIREMKGFARKDYKHESRFDCSVCKVRFCISKECNCFKKFHTLTQMEETELLFKHS